jgi:pSer/pThr/pTyr-binding forkhead associated (FHA) protein
MHVVTPGPIDTPLLSQTFEDTDTPDCDVRLPHPMVSRCHALLERLP